MEESRPASLLAFSSTPSLCCAIGMITTCVGATAGGSTSPLLSPCTMMIAPIMRVVKPQLVWWTYCSWLSLSVYWMPNARAKPSPKLWLVPDCRDFPSCIRLSMVYVAFAPAKRSFAVFSPLITGIAKTSLQKSAYTFSIRIVSSCASSAVACAVWPSCQRNSIVRRKGRVVFSQRTTEHH